MKKEQLVLFLINALGAMAYPLIAPLFPPLFKERDIDNLIVSFLIVIISLTNIISAIFCTYLCQKLGQLNLFLFCVIGQTFSTFFYGFSVYIKNNSLFLFLGFINRLFHGFCVGIINVASFSITSQINKGKELEKATAYMELSWGVGLTIGPSIIGILFNIGGYSLPFFIIGIISFSGIYFAYYILYKGNLEQYENKGKKELINEEEENNNINRYDVNNKNTYYLNALKYPPTILLALGIIIELNTLDFYVPTLVKYLKESFNIPTSKSSLFFLVSTLGYITCTQLINKVSNIFVNHKIIFYSLFTGGICCLFIAPANFLPQNYIFILFGIFIEGIIQGFVNITCFIELTNIGKKLFPNNKSLEHDIPSSIFNISCYIGELFEPILGSWITKKTNFKTSAYVSCFISVLFSAFFGCYFLKEINSSKPYEGELIIGKKLSNINS